MTVKQISVFLENKNGTVAEVLDTLSEGNIDIRAVMTAETEDYGVIRFIVDKPEEAKELLRLMGMPFVK